MLAEGLDPTSLDGLRFHPRPASVSCRASPLSQPILAFTLVQEVGEAQKKKTVTCRSPSAGSSILRALALLSSLGIPGEAKNWEGCYDQFSERSETKELPQTEQSHTASHVAVDLRSPDTQTVLSLTTLPSRMIGT